MDISVLQNWKATLESDIADLKSRIQALTLELQKKSHQLDHIIGLISSTEIVAVEKPVTKKTRAVNEMTQSSQEVTLPSANGTTPNEVKDHVYQILIDAKRPMKIGEIHAEFIRRGFGIPGKGTPFNILVHISRDLKSNKNGRFLWAGRGTYAAREQTTSTRNKK